MEKNTFISVFRLQKEVLFLVWVVLLVGFPVIRAEGAESNADSAIYITCKGLVVDAERGSPLSYATIMVEGTNIATVTNSEGEFSIKVPQKFMNNTILITYIGFQNSRVKVSTLVGDIRRIPLRIAEVNLSEVRIEYKDAEELMRNVFDLRTRNYVTEPTLMTAFYRETIKLRKSYVSLLEAVVDVYKYPIYSDREDMASLFKVRKKTDYTKLDTFVLKLAGGPYNTLCLDVMKNLEYTFTNEIFKNIDFKSFPATMIDQHPVYVVEFKQKPQVTEPLFYGKLYIDAVNLAMFSASFDMNLEDVRKASAVFILSKPGVANVEVTKAHYHVSYVMREGKWYMSYGRAEMNFKVNRKRRLFSSTFETVFEMAVTDWQPVTGEKWSRNHTKLKPFVIVTDETSGFSDAAFWGTENIIEPDKSIETAISKIKKNLKDR
ncbi:MAG TPA: carboxypeptidase-like regulatory domain-containing protein [Bacteroidales bacterium]|nr:carboxypeptidase-like regulatory domain-containing protein [Bacteroidales bacterium]